MKFYKVLPAIVMIGVLLSCSTKSTEEQQDTVYCSSSIRKIAATDYERAMQLADEGMRKGQISAFQSYELRSTITYHHTDKYDEAAEWLLRALEQKEAQDIHKRTDLLYHLATIYKSGREFTTCLATCTEGKELAHANGLAFEAHAFDFLAGNCLFAIGEDDAGLSMMCEAINGASSLAKTEDKYGHLLFFTGNLINCYTEVKDFKGALETCLNEEKLLAKMEERFPQTPADYLDRTHFYLDVDMAVCSAMLGDTATAVQYLASAMGREFASTDGGKFRMVDYYAAVGDPASILRIYEEFPYTNADTVNRAYRFRITRLKEAYSNAGLNEEAGRLGERYDRLSAMLEQKENAEGIREKAAIYDTQGYRLALGDTLSVLKKYRRGITSLMLLVIAAFAAFAFLNHRVSRRKEDQHLREVASWEKNLRSLQKQVSLIAERDMHKADSSDDEPKESSFKDLIEGQELFLNKNLNRESAASLLGISQAEITKALSEIEPGLSFPEYIKGLRISHALRLLGENPDIPITDLADRCGFYTTRTLQRSFLALTGKTPSEYARGLKIK